MTLQLAEACAEGDVIVDADMLVWKEENTVLGKQRTDQGDIAVAVQITPLISTPSAPARRSAPGVRKFGGA